MSCTEKSGCSPDTHNLHCGYPNCIYGFSKATWTTTMTDTATPTHEDGKLLPCPFCGARPKQHNYTGGDVQYICENSECRVTAYTMPCGSVQMAQDLWNTRAPTLEQKQGLTREELESVLYKAMCYPRFTEGLNERSKLVADALIAAGVPVRAETLRTEKAREALGKFVKNTEMVSEVSGVKYGYKTVSGDPDDILTALAPYLIPDGCEVICGVCKATKADWPDAKHNGGNCNSYNHVENGRPCPLRTDTKG